VLLTFAASSWAQDGVITGRITDTSGATMPGVDVSLTSPALLGGRSVVSDEQGSYRFALLPPGVYSLRFQLQGFATVIREGITLTPGFTSSLNIALEVASVAETVTVGRRVTHHRRHQRGGRQQLQQRADRGAADGP
jgi:hypothetical protein